MVPVEVGDADSAEAPGRHAGQQELALGAFARVEKDPIAVPAQQVAVLVAVPGGRLTRSPEDDQFSHGCSLAARGSGRARGPSLNPGGRSTDNVLKVTTPLLGARLAGQRPRGRETEARCDICYGQACSAGYQHR